MWADDLGYAGAVAPVVVAGIVAAVIWRSAAKERSRHALEAGLRSADPSVRRATLDAVDEATLARHAGLFCQVLDSEREPEVLDALARAVARSRWDPTDDGKIVELRRWVAGRHAADAAPVDELEPSTVPDEAPPVSADGTSTALAVASGAMMEPMGALDLAELAPRVRAVLGDGLDRMELVSIDGELLATWSAVGTDADVDTEPVAGHLLVEQSPDDASPGDRDEVSAPLPAW